VQALDTPVVVRAASEPAGVPASGGGAGADGANSTTAPAENGDEGAVPGEDSGQDGPTDDATDESIPTPTAFSAPPPRGDDGPGDTRREDAPGDDPPAPVVFGGDSADDPTGFWSGGTLLPGSGSDDTLIGGPGDDSIRGLGGDQTLDGRGGDDELYGGSEDDRLLGGDEDDHLEGGGGDDRLGGDAGDDDLDGGTGDDHLFGLDGDDRLIGGLGRDELMGGRGADRFVLNEIAESVAQDPDRLLDFRAYERDKIDVSGIDANSQTAQDEAFVFIEDDPFSGGAGELRFTESHGATYLYGDVNGDGETDFALELLGVSSLSVDDLIL
jgi:Ca2+-binding RTX toxin-like protein